MDRNDVQRALLKKAILSLLAKGLVLSEEILFFAESTCGLSPAGLDAALRDPQFEERQELLALILTPDMDMRGALEPQLSAEAIYTSADVTALALDLWREIDALHIYVPGGHRFSLPVDRSDVDYFVSKLYLDRRIDERLVALLNEIFTSETVIASRLMLRCRGDSLSNDKLDFIRSFIEKSQPYEEVFLKLFRLALKLLAEINESISIEDYFLGRRRQLITKLKEIRAFEQKRDHYSMEYLMMQRYRVPHESQEQIMDQLQMLTTITDAILGLPPDPSLHTDFRDLGTFGSAAAVADIIRALS